MRLTTQATGSTSVNLFTAFCFSTDQVGDAVYIMGDRVGRIYQVTKVDVDNVDIKKAVARGLILSKPSPTDCLVQTSGPFDGVFFGMTPGASLFVGTNSRPTETPAPPTTGVNRILQQIGYAVASDILWIDVGNAIRRRG